MTPIYFSIELFIAWSYIPLLQYLSRKYLLTQLLLNNFRVHESVIFEIIDKYLVKCLPFFHDILFRRRSPCSPNIFVIIFPQLYGFNSKAVRINLRPDILALVIYHHASIQYLQTYFMSVILKGTVSFDDLLLNFMSIQLRRN